MPMNGTTKLVWLRGDLRKKVVLENEQEMCWGVEKRLKWWESTRGNRWWLHLGVGTLLVRAGAQGKAMRADVGKKNPFTQM